MGESQSLISRRLQHRALSVSSGLLCNFVAVHLTFRQFILQLKLCLYTNVHLLLEEFKIYLKSFSGTQSLCHTISTRVEVPLKTRTAHPCTQLYCVQESRDLRAGIKFSGRSLHESTQHPRALTLVHDCCWAVIFGSSRLSEPKKFRAEPKMLDWAAPRSRVGVPQKTRTPHPWTHIQRQRERQTHRQTWKRLKTIYASLGTVS